MCKNPEKQRFLEFFKIKLNLTLGLRGLQEKQLFELPPNGVGVKNKIFEVTIEYLISPSPPKKI